MRTVKTVLLGILVAISICLLFYSVILKTRVDQLNESLDECGRLMTHYSDSSEVEKQNYEKKIMALEKKVEEKNQIIQEYVKSK